MLSIIAILLATSSVAVSFKTCDSLKDSFGDAQCCGTDIATKKDDRYCTDPSSQLHAVAVCVCKFALIEPYNSYSEDDLLNFISGPDAGGNSIGMVKGYQLWGVANYYTHMNHYVQRDTVTNKTYIYVFESGTSETLKNAWTQLVTYNMANNFSPDATVMYPMATWDILDMSSPENMINFMGLHTDVEAELKVTLAGFGPMVKFSKTMLGGGAYTPISKDDGCTGQVPRTPSGAVDFSSTFPAFTDPPSA